MEDPNHCVQSVLDIRRYLTAELQSLHSSSDLSGSLRALRAACRKFMDATGARSDIMRNGMHRGHWASWEFNGALGEMRGVFGIHLARIAAAHGLDVEGDLAGILPGIPGDEDPEGAES
jgi:hypothetical protein